MARGRTLNLRRYRDFAIVLLALAIPFWFLRASMRDPKNVTGPDRVIVRVAAPLQWFAATLARGVSNIWGDYVWLVDVKEDNSNLSSQNARLRERVRKLEPLEDENRRLKRLLELKQNLRADTVSAQVIGKNTDEYFRVLRVTLDREVAGSLPANLAVLAQDGVVGTTLKSAGDTVDVRLVVDAGSGVDVVVQRTGARGFARGGGEEHKYLCKVQYMERTDEVEVGDLLVTSGMGRRFPKGVPVATVTQVVKKDFGVYQEVIARPAVDFSRLSEVLIVLTAPLEDPQTARAAPSAAPKP